MTNGRTKLLLQKKKKRMELAVRAIVHLTIVITMQGSLHSTEASVIFVHASHVNASPMVPLILRLSAASARMASMVLTPLMAISLAREVTSLARAITTATTISAAAITTNAEVTIITAVTIITVVIIMAVTITVVTIISVVATHQMQRTACKMQKAINHVRAATTTATTTSVAATIPTLSIA